MTRPIWTITEVRQHFLIRTILNTDSITTNTIISSRIISNHRYNRNQARIPSPQQKDSRSVNTLLISHLAQFLYIHKESKSSKAHPEPRKGNTNRIARQQQTNKYRINKTNIIKATISHTIRCRQGIYATPIPRR